MIHQGLWTFSALWVELEEAVQELNEQGVSVEVSEAEITVELMEDFLNVVLPAEV